MRCSLCQIALTEGLVNIRFRGQRRHFSVKLNGVPAHVCPRCEQPVVGPDLEARLEAMGRTMEDTAGPMYWQVERAA
ncbi:hypothetical protein D3C72_763800 [compost metagenome]